MGATRSSACWTWGAGRVRTHPPAQATDHVVAVDVNPHAVAATADNASRNGVGERVQAIESDVFERVEGYQRIFVRALLCVVVC